MIVCAADPPSVNPRLVAGTEVVDLPHARGEHPDMALTHSSPLDANFTIPDFLLPDVASGQNVSAAACAGERGTAVIFLCRHCPYVVHVFPTLLDLARTFIPQGIGFTGISANNAATHPDDAPEQLKSMVGERQIPFPILHDETQDTARAFHAACTPEFYVFDREARLFYHGRMDGSTPGNNLPCTGADLRAALDALVAGQAAPSPQHPSMGCNIKWK
jgi:thiol-disulfide isomerase/thioredoxin